MCSTQVCYSQFQPLIAEKLIGQFLPNLRNLFSSYTVPHIPNLQEIALAIPSSYFPHIFLTRVEQMINAHDLYFHKI